MYIIFLMSKYVTKYEKDIAGQIIFLIKSGLIMRTKVVIDLNFSVQSRYIIVKICPQVKDHGGRAVMI